MAGDVVELSDPEFGIGDKMVGQMDVAVLG